MCYRGLLFGTMSKDRLGQREEIRVIFVGEVYVAVGGTDAADGLSGCTVLEG